MISVILILVNKLVNLDFNTANTNSEAMARPKKPVGIQFVKSADMMGNPQDIVESTEMRSNSKKVGLSTQALSKRRRQRRRAGMRRVHKASFLSNKKSSDLTTARSSDAKPTSLQDYLDAWGSEVDPFLKKIRKLAYEVVNLKVKRQNCKLFLAASRVPLDLKYSTQRLVSAKNETDKNAKTYVSTLSVEEVNISEGIAPTVEESKTIATNICLQQILMPHLCVKSIDSTRRLEASEDLSGTTPRLPSNKSAINMEVPSSNNISCCTDSNFEVRGLKRINGIKPLEDFVIFEPMHLQKVGKESDILRGSAIFSHMILDYEYSFSEILFENVRCILRVENVILADVKGVFKFEAGRSASVQALQKLKRICWTIKVKQAVNAVKPCTEISREYLLSKTNATESEEIKSDNIGHKLLCKMGWSGGGIGKDGSGISEPVFLNKVKNRQGLGHTSPNEVNKDFRKRVIKVIQKFAASTNEEDIAFSCDFNNEERRIIHIESTSLGFRSKSRGKGEERYLILSRKRSANELLDYLMSVGGETAQYLLIGPGQDCDVNNTISPAPRKNSSPFSSTLDHSSNTKTGSSLQTDQHQLSPLATGNEQEMACNNGELVDTEISENISKPMPQNAVCSRETLGLSSAGVTEEFLMRVREIVQNFADSDKERLVFSIDFQNDERKAIHNICRDLGVRSKSKGKGEERYLCINHIKRKVKERTYSLRPCPGQVCIDNVNDNTNGPETKDCKTEFSSAAPLDHDSNTMTGSSQQNNPKQSQPVTTENKLQSDCNQPMFQFKWGLAHNNNSSVNNYGNTLHGNF